MTEKYVCINKCNFIIGNIYEWTYDKENGIYLHKHWRFFPEDFDIYFINLNKWREKIINKILEND